jgi:hypothetical protein
MAKKKQIVEITEGEIVTPSKEEKVEVKDSISVRCSGRVHGGPVGGFIRTFTKKDHGEQFEELAKAWAVRYDGKIV